MVAEVRTGFETLIPVIRPVCTRLRHPTPRMPRRQAGSRRAV